MIDTDCPGESSDAVISGPEDERAAPDDQFMLPRGHRPAGSVAEERAARRVMHAFHAHATPAITLPATVPVTPGYAELLSSLLLLLCILLGLFQPVLGALTLLLGIALYAAETAGEGLLARVVPRRPTTSVLAAIPAQRRELRRVVVVTALDSPTTGLLDKPPLATIGRFGPHALVVSGSVAATLFVWQALIASPPSDGWLIVPAAALGALLALYAEPSLVRKPPEPEEPATDALRAIVEFGARVRTHPTHWVDVWCFVAGGGNVSGEALRQFIRDNRLVPETTYFVNLMPHPSALSIAITEGPLWKRRSAPALVRVLVGVWGKRPRSRLARTTQAAVPIGMGYQAITVGLPLDSADHAPDETLDVTHLLLDTLTVIDNELVERNRVARLARPSSQRTGRVARPPNT